MSQVTRIKHLNKILPQNTPELQIERFRKAIQTRSLPPGHTSQSFKTFFYHQQAFTRLRLIRRKRRFNICGEETLERQHQWIQPKRETSRKMRTTDKGRQGTKLSHQHHSAQRQSSDQHPVFSLSGKNKHWSTHPPQSSALKLTPGHP